MTYSRHSLLRTTSAAALQVKSQPPLYPPKGGIVKSQKSFKNKGFNDNSTEELYFPRLPVHPQLTVTAEDSALTKADLNLKQQKDSL